MDTFFDYDVFENLGRMFFHLTGKEVPNTIIAISFCLFWVTIVVGIVLRIIHKNNKWREKQLNEILKGYENYTTRQERRLYIDTRLLIEPLDDYDEPSEAQQNNLHGISIDSFIKKIFKKDNVSPHYYCILGGSGIGKSTFVVNFVRKYIYHHKEKNLPYKIKLLYCGENTNDNDTILKQIDTIKDKSTTILILDALDENDEAIDNFSKFFPELLKRFFEFRIVIITCRTQFFEKRKNEPQNLPNRDPKTHKQKQFEKYYISPLNNAEIRRYLNKKFILKFSSKKKAKSIVRKCNKLMARPLLLSYIDDIVNSDITDYSISHIYEIIIDKWLEREANFSGTNNIKNYKSDLFNFSLEVAKILVQNQSKTINGIVNNNSQSRIHEAILNFSSIINKNNLKSRSLLFRNPNDYYTFAHKSFIEFIIAKRLFEKNDIPIRNIDFDSFNMIPVFWMDMINNEFKNKTPTIDSKNKYYFQYIFNIDLDGIQIDFNRHHFSIESPYSEKPSCGLLIEKSYYKSHSRFISELSNYFFIEDIMILWKDERNDMNLITELINQIKIYDVTLLYYDFNNKSIIQLLENSIPKFCNITFEVRERPIYNEDIMEELKKSNRTIRIILKHNNSNKTLAYKTATNKEFLYKSYDGISPFLSFTE